MNEPDATRLGKGADGVRTSVVRLNRSTILIFVTRNRYRETAKRKFRNRPFLGILSPAVGKEMDSTSVCSELERRAKRYCVALMIYENVRSSSTQASQEELNVTRDHVEAARLIFEGAQLEAASSASSAQR
jgi:hypothetical protein